MMLRIAVIVAFVLSALGCAQANDPGSNANTEFVNSDSDTSNQQADSVQSSDRTSSSGIAGSYYRGDGLGLNLHLTLAGSGTFRCEWTGCLGNYGNTSGTWSQAKNRIVIKATKVDGMFKQNPLGDLELIQRDGDTVLVQTNDRDFFEEWGPSRYSCFSRTD